MKRRILSKAAAFFLIFVLGFAAVAGSNVSTVEAATRSSLNITVRQSRQSGVARATCPD